MVTPLQTLQSMNVFATGGLLVRPRVVKQDSAACAGPVRIISEKTAADLVQRAFVRVVEEGTGEHGRLDGFGAAGKTGTAKKYDHGIGAYTDEYTSSFVGFTPLGRPRLSMIVVLDEPKGEMHYGGQVAAPVFRDISARVLRYLGAAPKPKEGRDDVDADHGEGCDQGVCQFCLWGVCIGAIGADG